MVDHSKDTALVTGANSGLGLEAAAQLAEAGWGKVILACRTEAKGAAAAAQLIQRSRREEAFDTLALELAEPASIEAAVRVLAARGRQVDFLLLNAGTVTQDASRNDAGIELGFAVANVGHHLFTMRLLEAGLLGAHARLVIAGSEAARGDVPGMKLPDLEAVARRDFGGDLAATLEAMARADPQVPLTPNASYAVSKCLAAWWAAALASRLPRGMTVNAVSPGSAPDTNFSRNMGFFGRHLMIPMMKRLGPLFGMAGPMDVAARRYLAAAEFSAEKSGAFYASRAGKLVGPVEVQTQQHLVSRAAWDAGWQVLVKLSGGVDFPSGKAPERSDAAHLLQSSAAGKPVAPRPSR